jgi:SAM-dependent methyltransferase
MGLYRSRILPWAIDHAMSRGWIGEQRRPVLADVAGRVLEVGFGTGTSLAAYPPGKIGRIVAVEPNRGMWARARRRARAAGVEIELVAARAHAMPFEDAAFDTVVSGFTLCSIRPLRAALAEIRRVLAPDGRFLFVEHGRSDDPRTARWQRRLTPLHAWYADGCLLDVPVDDEIRAAGFDLEGLERYVAPRGWRPFVEMYRGTARPRVVRS